MNKEASNPEYDRLQAERKETNEFEAWRKEEKEKLPALAERVFALRKKFYSGCGFHYSMEGTLGSVIKELNNVDSRYYHGKPGDVISARIVLKVIVEGLYEDVEKAEASAEDIKKNGI